MGQSEQNTRGSLRLRAAKPGDVFAAYCDGRNLRSEVAGPGRGHGAVHLAALWHKPNK
jgi:hypothetical protein